MGSLPLPFAQVALLTPHFATLTYILPEYLPAEAFFVGQRVAVPLGRGVRMGVLVGFSGESGIEFEGAAIKALLWPLEKEPVLSPGYLDMALQLAHRQSESLGRILGGLLPAGLRTVKVRLRFFGSGRPRDLRVNELAALPREDLAALGSLWMAGRVEVCRTGRNPLDAELCLLVSDPPWAVRPAARAQMALLEYLFEHGAVTRRKLIKDLGPKAAATLATLTGRSLVHIRPADSFVWEEGAQTGAPLAPPLGSFDPTPDPFAHECGAADKVRCFTLTPKQREVFDELLAAVRQGESQARLLFGITGSGKTAVYLELAREVLALGRSVLILAPEVALALKLWTDATAALPFSVLPRERRVLFHGYQSAAAKEAAFFTLARAVPGQPYLVIGTRSALWLPLEGVGLIVLDEEHDASFKQDEGLAYQAKEVAWYRASRQKSLLLMGSATPDVKTYHAAREGRIPMHCLTERVGGGTLPEVRLAHLPRNGSAESEIRQLAPESMKALREVTEKGEQAVILLNRRGYAPIMYCQSCASVAKCPHCDIGLTYHKGRERLLCHYCGFSLPYPSPCINCKSARFLPMGEGTEKLEESLHTALAPGTGILRLDKDSTRRPGRMEEILAAFARKEAAVLVGTQMLSKGHHFPDVTLAIVVDADLGLNLPDYRAAERTFQLLLQAAGRSGRSKKPGKVLIQTRDPSHYCWEYVIRADFEGFFERELALRKRRRYPPFVRLALLRISHSMDRESGPDEVAALGERLRKTAPDLGVTVLGPAPAPLPFLKGRRRWHCLLKSDDWQSLRALFNEALVAARSGSLRVKLDLDPVNML